MAETSLIEWTDATWNPVTGCSVVSPGCTNCYAMRLAGTRLRGHASRAGLTRETKAGPVWTGEVRLNEGWLTQPLQWRRPRKIFVCAHGDLFAEGVPDAWIDRVFAVMALAPWHTFQVLTKRADRMRAYMAALRCDGGYRPFVRRPGWQASDPRDADRVLLLSEGQTWPLPNVWLGVSAEDQRRADERVPELLATPAAVRFVSAEPLLGPLSLEPWLAPNKFCEQCDDGEGYGSACSSARTPRDAECPWRRAVQIETLHPPFSDDGMAARISVDVRTLDWVIVGGESGPGARPMHPAWARSLRDQCAAAGVPFHFKQWGAWKDGSDFAPYAMAITLDGRVIALTPDALREADRVEPLQGQTMMHRVGKAAAGRLLDGVEHNGIPGGAA